MRLIGIAGWSGSGKTTLIEKLIPCLIARGLSVSTVKHAHHAFDVDQPGKDSYRHRKAGAHDVLVASAKRFALMREHRGEPEPELDALCAQLAPVDVVLVEGFKRTGIPKIEVHQQTTGKTLLQPDDPWIVAVAADVPLIGLTVPCLALDDIEGVADVVSGLLSGPALAERNAGGDAPDGPDLSVVEALTLLAREARPVCGPEPIAVPLAKAAHPRRRSQNRRGAAAGRLRRRRRLRLRA
jgi:molybdopterin-guanine dinucleotide biosynthesis protein B